MKIKKLCRTFLITDTPSEIDEFGGSHKRVAEAIAELIIYEEGGKSIGLEGEWGTGKSTVISLLRDLLNSPHNNEEYKLFLFDAWAHESDPLRKIFLEQLLDFLRKNNWITEKQWEENWKGDWEEFIGQKTTSTTESSPKITKFGGFLIIASFFIPLGLALINNALRNNAIFNVFSGIEMGYVLSWQLLTGSILSLFPLLGFLLILIRYIREKTIKKGKDIKINWAIFAQKYDVLTTTLSTKTPNPTSVEFEKFFTKLINTAISNKNRHLIIVLDNLDRISPTDALSILSTLQTFLQCQSKLEMDKLNRLWILIPYDRNGLEKLWQTTEKNGDEIKTNVANSMMEKRFQIRFRVPPLILSNWEEYFQKQFRNALPDHDEKEFYSAYRIYYYFLNKKIDYKTIQNPTPRQIKIFINQIGTLHRQWVDKIPLAQMAYFICLQNNKENIQKILLNGEMPDKEIQFYLGEEILENLSAMWFNVDQKIAFQTLLQAPIESLIINRNFVELSNLASTHGNIFWVIFSKLPINYWAKNAPLNLTNIAYFLLQGRDSILNNFDSRESFVSTLVQYAKVVENWKPFNEQMSEGLSSLFILNPDRLFAVSIIEKITRIECDELAKNSVANPIEANVLDKIQEEITIFSNGIIQLIKINELKLVEYFLEKPISINLNSYQFIEICSNFAFKDPENNMWGVFIVNNDPNDVSSAFISIINGSNFTKRHIGAIRVMLKKMPEIPFLDIAEAISEKVNDANTENISGLLECLWILEINKEVLPLPIIQPLIQSGSIANHLILKFDNQDYLSCAWCIFLLIAFDPGLTIQQNKRGPEGIAKLKEFYIKPEDPQFFHILDNLENIICLYTHVNFVVEFYGNNPESLNLVNVILLYFAKMDKPEIYFTGEIINNNWKEIIEIIGNDHFDTLISNVITNGELINFIRTNFSNDKAGLYNIIFKSLVSIKQHKDFSKWISQNLQNISKEEWLDGFKTENELISLLLTLLNNDVKIDLGIPFIDAYVEYSNLVLMGEIKPEKYLTEWEKIPQSLTNKTYKKTLILKIIDNLKDNQNGITSDFFDIYGNLINQPELLMDNVDIVRKLFTRLIENKNVRGLEWLSNLFNAHPKILLNHEENEGVIYFKDLLRNSLDQNNEESIQKNLDQIALVLGIEKHSQEISEEIQEDSSSN